MRNLFLLLLAGIGLAVFGYFDQKKHAASALQMATDAKQLEVLQDKLDSAESDLKQAKVGVQERADFIVSLQEEKKKELAEAQTALVALQTKLDEAAKAVPPPEEAAKPMAEVEELRTKLSAAETALAQAKTEVAAAQATAAAKTAEVQRLQTLQTRPPLGSAMEKRK